MEPQHIWPWLLLMVPPMAVAMIEAGYGIWWPALPAFLIQALTLIAVSMDERPFSRKVVV